MHKIKKNSFKIEVLNKEKKMTEVNKEANVPDAILI